MTEPAAMPYRYRVVQLDSDRQVVAYLKGLAAKEFDVDVTHRLTPDLALAWPLPDEHSAQEIADGFNENPANPHLDVIELPAESDR